MFDSATTLDQLVHQVHETVGSAAVMVTRPLESHQDILAHAGAALPVKFADRQPRSHSICRHVSGMKFPLVVDNAYTHPLLRGHAAVGELGIAAYAGAPISLGDDQPPLVLCATDSHQRRWSKQDIATLLVGARRAESILGTSALTP